MQIGKIVSTHGIAGDLKVVPWCDEINVLVDINTFIVDNSPYRVEFIKPHKNILIIHLNGVDSIEKAQNYIGHILYTERSLYPIKTGSYFITDLLGVKVFDADDKERFYGAISDVIKTGANDVYVLKDNSGREKLIPAILDVICKVDIKNRRMLIKPIPGLFNED